eukprot:TRINITY_DN76264_c0_g1_i1.p1 TRINITY_DN76264_c0_g1~~TRINITY_DN76264_c0_g1_i1.p1  ORF type:complete len:398 (+),score=97.74 TRINITY_DN76264_c0_g1_i1:79-1272(+)
MPASQASTAMRDAAGEGDVPFESAASELVDEGAHPLEQLSLLDAKASDLQAAGDLDAVVECRIKQKALQQVLVYLYGFPLQPLVKAQATLAEAYAAGGYYKQAHEHLAKAREVSFGGIYDDAQCQQIQVDLLLADGAIRLSQQEFEAAHASLLEAARLVREVYGEMDVRAARIHTMLGDVAKQRGRHSEAIDHFCAAWEVRECLDGADGEETIRTHCRIAEVEYLDGRKAEAIERQQKVVSMLERQNLLAGLLVNSCSQLSRWLEGEGRDAEALEAMQAAEKTILESTGAEDVKAVEVKRDVALLHLKLGDHETALQYLNDVHFYERRLHGSGSINVARTLKALGTVHLVRRNLEDAEQCLLQALRIFQAEYPSHQNIVKDIHAKLQRIAEMARGEL